MIIQYSHGTIFILTLCLQLSRSKLINESCQTNLDCSAPKLVCAKTDPNSETSTTSTTSTTCQCDQGLVWINSKCVSADVDNQTLELVSILSPLFAAGLVTLGFLVVCCCCLHKSSNAELEQVVVEDKYDIEKSGTMFEDFSDESNQTQLNKPTERPKSVKSKNESSELKELQGSAKQNGSAKRSQETTLILEKETSRTPKISIDHAVELNGQKQRAEVKTDQAYQASLKLLLERPLAGGSEPSSRPMSAMNEESGIYRSGSALNFGRQSSLSLLVPRDIARPSSATSLSGRRSPVITGPYLSDPSNLKFVQLRSYQLSPKTSFIFENRVLEEEETSFIVNAKHTNPAIETIKNENRKVVESEKKKEVKKKEKAKTKPRSLSIESGIEEIRLVQAAVNAFKRKTRLRDLPNKTPSKFETVVERVIRLREEQNLGSKNNSDESKKKSLERETEKNNNNNNNNVKSKKRVNFQTDLSSLESFSEGSNSVSLTPRPQSVAQRILKERQERNITAKVPVTPNAKTNKKGKEKQRQPLYLALKATAQKKKQTSKTEMTEKIRQEAHLNAVKNYSVPPLPKEYHENMLKLQNNAFLSDRKENNNKSSNDDNNKPIKSILKKTSITTSSQNGSRKSSSSKTIRKVSRVNYAFESDENENKKDDLRKKNSVKIVAEVH